VNVKKRFISKIKLFTNIGGRNAAKKFVLKVNILGTNLKIF
jgi:hypothetical protein